MTRQGFLGFFTGDLASEVFSKDVGRIGHDVGGGSEYVSLDDSN